MRINGVDGTVDIPPDRPVLIAGPTASGKSGLALEIAETDGGVIVNADASQVFDCWRVITARPSVEEEKRTPHRLYGHVAWDQTYSAGHWLRDVRGILDGPERPIIVGGTGLYFSTLTRGMADIPATPQSIRDEADTLELERLVQEIDPQTAAGIDLNNRARVQRAWEVERATGRSLRSWQAETPPPALALDDTVPLVMENPTDWLNQRIERRFDQMLEQGALDEARCMQDRYDPGRPAFRAIGVPELMAHLNGEIPLTEARELATQSTRQYAKRQRTWFRSKMKQWAKIHPNR